MKNEYRLIQVIESFDNITRRPIDIFEMTPIEYNYSKTGYNFNPMPSAKNHFFIYDRSENMQDKYLNENERVYEISTLGFHEKDIETPVGVRKTFFSNILCKLRNQQCDGI